MLPDLHKFVSDLDKRPGNGAAVPPRVVRAKDLDENFEKLTLVEPQKGPPDFYVVEYRREGTKLLFASKTFDICENGQPVQYSFVAVKAE
jgi:hypothetical protein